MSLGSIKYSLTIMLQNFVGPLSRLIVYISPLIFSKLYGPTQYLNCPVLPFLQTNIRELRGRLQITVVLGPLCMLNISITQCSTCIFFTSFIAFLNVITRCVTIGEGTLNSAIQGYALNTNSMGIRLSSPVKLLIALKAICNTMSLLIPSILEVIMWYMYCKGLQ